MATIAYKLGFDYLHPGCLPEGAEDEAEPLERDDVPHRQTCEVCAYNWKISVSRRDERHGPPEWVYLVPANAPVQ